MDTAPINISLLTDQLHAAQKPAAFSILIPCNVIHVIGNKAGQNKSWNNVLEVNSYIRTLTIKILQLQSTFNTSTASNLHLEESKVRQVEFVTAKIQIWIYTVCPIVSEISIQYSLEKKHFSENLQI